MCYSLNFMDERLCKMIHHRNQLKNYRDKKQFVLDNLNVVEIDIDFSENLDKPVKYEPQSLHWTSDQVDLVLEKILEQVGEDLDGKVIVICSDNCCSQY